MRDFTRDSIAGHVMSTAAPLALSLFLQTAYPVVDIYFVARLGAAAVAGVNAAASVMFVVSALLQVLVVGTIAPVAHAVGRRDRNDANLVFNQAVMLAVTCSVALTLLVAASASAYMRLLSSDRATIEAGTSYLAWALPGYVLLLPMGIFSCALRAAGNMQVPVAAYTLTILVNCALAPVLIAGWGTGIPLGVRGAGLATSVAGVLGIVCMVIGSCRIPTYMKLQPWLMRPRVDQWRRIVAIGFPSGTEFAVVFLSTAIVYYTIRDFGPSAQAGFSIGSRILQVLLVPAVAIGVAVGPIAGQNYGAQQGERVKQTLRSAMLTGLFITSTVFALVQWNATSMASLFRADDAATEVAASFLQLMSWALIAQCLVYIGSGIFQGLGDTMPSLIAGTARLVTFAVPVLALSALARFRIEYVWYLSAAAVLVQALVSCWLLGVNFARRLRFGTDSAITSCKRTAAHGL